jgi:hypothetical protein
MKDDGVDQHIEYFRRIIKDNQLNYLYGDAWNAVSFDYIHHPDQRPDPTPLKKLCYKTS